MEKIKYVDLFAGVGGIRLGFEQALAKVGIEGECVLTSEIKASAKKVYQENFGQAEITGDITEVDAKDIEDFDYLLGGFPCFVGDTLVLTDQGYKEIQYISVGDKVLSHDKGYHEITNKLYQGFKPTVRVTTDIFDEIITTNNHKFYVREVLSFSGGRINLADPVWKEISEIRADGDKGRQYYMGTALNQEGIVPLWTENTINIPIWGEKDRSTEQGDGMLVESPGYKEIYKNTLDMREAKLWYLAGRYTRMGRKLDTNGVLIVCKKEEVSKFEEKIKITSHTNFRYTKKEENGYIRYHFSDTELGVFLKKFGPGGYTNTIPPFVYDLPIELLKEYIAGYVDSEESEQDRTNQNPSKTIIKTDNKQLAYGLSHCIMKAYKVPCSIHSETYPMGGFNLTEYNIEFINGDVFRDTFYEEGYVWYPIHTIENTGLNEEVWDISVEDSHSFVANNCIVHNCQAFSKAGLRRGFEDTRGTLFFDVARILAEKKPRGFILENVEGLITHERTQEQKKNGEVGQTLQTMLEILDELGYNVSYKVLEGTDFGVPQRRRRIFLVGDKETKVSLDNFKVYPPKYIKDITENIGYSKECEFNEALQTYLKDEGKELEYLYGKQVKDVRAGGNNISGWDLGLRGKVTEREKEILDGIRGRRRLKANKETKGAAHKDFAGLFMEEIEELVGFDPKEEVKRLLELGYLAEKDINGHNTIDLRGSRLSYKYAKILDPNDYSLTIVATDARVNGVVDGGGVRGLTKKELLRLNGFPEDFTMESVTRNQALDLMGNTVIVPIVKAISERLLAERK